MPEGLGGGKGRRKGLKIPRGFSQCGFDSRPRHYQPLPAKIGKLGVLGGALVKE